MTALARAAAGAAESFSDPAIHAIGKE